MKATILLDGPEERIPVEIDARDRRAFERLARRDLGKVAEGALSDVIRAIPETYMAWCAWHAWTRDGARYSWPDAEKRIARVVVEDEAEETADPTQPGHTPGS